jgi:hypothetical protein
MVLNLDTGKISPQYHLVFDDTFSTVYSDGAFNADVLNSLVTSNLELHTDEPSTVPTIFDFTDTNSIVGDVGQSSSSSSMLPSSSTDTKSVSTTDVLYFIENLPGNRPIEFPALPDDIDDHLPTSNSGPASSF